MSLEYTVIWPLDGSARACAGLIAVCPWNGTSYSASTTWAAPLKALSGFPTRIGLELDVGVALRMYLNKSSEEGKGAVAGFSQFTLSCLAALIACSSRSHTTAT